MRVVFRTDASLKIGTGHVMRCLTLAEVLSSRGAEVAFICRANAGNLIPLIKERGFDVTTLHSKSELDQFQSDLVEHASWLECDWQTDALQSREALQSPVDWIVVDHYALDKRWETALRDRCTRMMCIDDLADRKHDCDMLLDQSLGRSNRDYLSLVSEHTELFLGPKYALLRPEFAQWRDTSLLRRDKPQLRHILVTMGGVDIDNITSRVLNSIRICNVPALEQITVVMGPHSPWISKIQSQAKQMEVPTQVVSGINNMAERMTACDLSIGAGGSTTWERCALGIPAITIILAKNQIEVAEQMKVNGASLIMDLEKNNNIKLARIIDMIDSQRLETMSRKSRSICDAQGAIKVSERLEHCNA